MQANLVPVGPPYGTACLDEQHCFDCDMDRSTTACTEPHCSVASGSTSIATTTTGSANSNLAHKTGGFGGSENQTCHCTSNCIVVACDDPDHAEPICNEQGPHSMHCDLGCAADIECRACHGFDDFVSFFFTFIRNVSGQLIFVSSFSVAMLRELSCAPVWTASPNSQH